ncbi:DUF4160 domain-containing protein [Ancylothrix sp. C2]|uniref:DUF4160 domain-containing protein n=1 Tax=Ancylothrix sp. D3o TaxID=2953691 RepID=UPI0021BAB7C6|nr:DUF4160 domain-containing protein [Ancylothrix sp. D3o]MCT7952452.1 DUF4160 domain-containing protein [Ancylothrix sp. D3o]
MPKVLEDLENNLFVYIYTNDHVPAHVHVFKGRKNDSNQKEVKINIGNQMEIPSVVNDRDDMENKHIIPAALKLVTAHRETLLRKWQKIHGTS